MNDIFFANHNWSQLENNPFHKDGEYGEKWSAFIYDSSISGYSNVKLEAKIYSLTVNPEIDKDYERLIDFVTYESSYNRNVIIKAPDNMKKMIQDKLLKIEKGNKNNCIREKEPRWLVHSTTKELWEKIKESGALLSPNYLKSKGIEVREIGLKQLLEPADYSEYIMLDVLDGCGELVVNSRQLGYVCIDPNIEYKPGVRLYFDGHRIINEGLGVRDGLHILKVHQQLTLDYMVLVVEERMLQKQVWTPTTYTDAANSYFVTHIKNQLSSG